MKTDWRRDLIGTIAVGGFVAICVLVLMGNTIADSMEKVALIIIGQLSMKFGTVVDFFYGSSHSSQAKDQTISDMSKKGSP